MFFSGYTHSLSNASVGYKLGFNFFHHFSNHSINLTYLSNHYNGYSLIRPILAF